MSLLNQFSALFQGFMDSAPWLVVHDLWLYLLIAAGGFGALQLIDFLLLTHMQSAWVMAILHKYTGDYYRTIRNSGPAFVLSILFTGGYAIASYFGQFGYALAIFAILAAVDVFTDRFTAGTKLVPPLVQARLVQITIIFDVLDLLIFTAAGLLFQHFVLLA